MQKLLKVIVKETAYQKNNTVPTDNLVNFSVICVYEDEEKPGVELWVRKAEFLNQKAAAQKAVEIFNDYLDELRNSQNV